MCYCLTDSELLHFTFIFIVTKFINAMCYDFRESESRLFPPDKVTVANLLNFIISNMDPISRLQLSLSACGTPCIHTAWLTVQHTIRTLQQQQRTTAAHTSNLAALTHSMRGKVGGVNALQYLMYLREQRLEVVLKLRHMKNLSAVEYRSAGCRSHTADKQYYIELQELQV